MENGEACKDETSSSLLTTRILKYKHQEKYNFRTNYNQNKSKI